jgi:hypothetical protein
MKPTILICSPDSAVRSRLTEVLPRLTGNRVDAEAFETASCLKNRLSTLRQQDQPVAMVIACERVLADLREIPGTRGIRKILLSQKACANDLVVRLMMEDQLHGRLRPDFHESSLALLLKEQLTEYVTQEGHELILLLLDLLDKERISQWLGEGKSTDRISGYQRQISPVKKGREKAR